MANWYYLRDGEQRGPVSSEQMQQWAAAGNLTAQDLVWRDGMGEWQTLGAVAELMPSRPAQRAAGATAVQQQATRSAVQPVAGPVAAAAPVVGYVGHPGYQDAPTASPEVSPTSVRIIKDGLGWMRLVSVVLFVLSGLTTLLVGLAFIAVIQISTESQISSSASSKAIGVMLVLIVVLVAIAVMYFLPGRLLWRAQSKFTEFAISKRSMDLESGLRAQMGFFKALGIAMILMIGFYLFMFLLSMIRSSRDY